ncbi:MAG TPA: pyridoxamine 5'-phosphate oxidase family protein [Nitrososphaerales archaeon]|nr:pyridoxamine 5'-phosphate oxidase family protein [Nitrososphaerales archaeon]
MGVLTKKQLRFLESHELCRLATASKLAVPHVVPVIYAMDRQSIVIASDYKTRKLRDLNENPVAAVLVDDFKPNRAVLVEGACKVQERGSEYLRLLKVLFDRFEYYRKNPWDEGEAPILVVEPAKAVSWGI